MKLQVTVKQEELRESAGDGSDPIPITFPLLLWEPTFEILLLATVVGTGMVVAAGKSNEVTVGTILPYAASRWVRGDEHYDFIPAPEGMVVALGNTTNREKGDRRLWKRGR